MAGASRKALSEKQKNHIHSQEHRDGKDVLWVLGEMYLLMNKCMVNKESDILS